MPRRRYGRRRFNRRRKPRAKRVYKKPLRYQVADMAASALKGVNYIRGLVNSEMFYKYTQSNLNPVGTAGQVVYLTGLAQGDGASASRTGNSVLAKNLFGRYQATLSSGSTGIMRILIVQDTQQVADSSPAVTDILDTANVLSPLNRDAAGRFSILKDHTITLDTSSQNKHHKCNVTLNNHIKFNGTADTDVQKNGVYMIALDSNNNTRLDYFWTFNYHDN